VFSSNESVAVLRGIQSMMPEPCRVLIEYGVINDLYLLAIELPPEANRRDYRQEAEESLPAFAHRAANAYLEEFNLRFDVRRYESRAA
jgi:hypothetical protein